MFPLLKKIIKYLAICIVIIGAIVFFVNYNEEIKQTITKLYTDQSHEPSDSDNDFQALFERSRETETFGEYQYSEFDGKHYGIDYDLPEDTPIKAATNGVVTRSFNNKLGGKVMQIKEDNGRYHQWYMHLNTFKLAEGERVKAGDIIALSGNTGEQTTGSHLHFQRMKDGVGNQFAVDPKAFIDKLPNGEESLYQL